MDLGKTHIVVMWTVGPDEVAAVREAVGAVVDSLGGDFTMDYVTLAAATTLN